MTLVRLPRTEEPNSQPTRQGLMVEGKRKSADMLDLRDWLEESRSRGTILPAQMGPSLRSETNVNVRYITTKTNIEADAALGKISTIECRPVGRCSFSSQRRAYQQHHVDVFLHIRILP